MVQDASGKLTRGGEGSERRREIRISKGIKRKHFLLIALRNSTRNLSMSPWEFLTRGSPYQVYRQAQYFPPLAVSVCTCRREYTQKTGQGPWAREKPQIQEAFKASFMAGKNQRRHKTLRNLKNYITRQSKKNGEKAPTQQWETPRK